MINYNRPILIQELYFYDNNKMQSLLILNNIQELQCFNDNIKL